MEAKRSAFRNVIRSIEVDRAKPVDEYLVEIDAFIDAHNGARMQ